jgi:hypothetical protein
MRAVASGGVAAFGVLGDECLEGVEGVASRLGVALREVLHADIAEQAQVLVEGCQALQVIGVIDVGMVGVEADEAFAGGDRGGGFVLAEIGIGDFELRLLCIASVGKAGLEFFKILDGLVVGAFSHGVLGFGVQLVGRPVGGFVDDVGQQSASSQEEGADDRDGRERPQECRYTTHGENLATKCGRL